MDARPAIRVVQVADLDDFFAYLEDQLKDNGENGVPLFHPYSRHTPWLASEKAALFRTGMGPPIGAPGWRRAWAAFDEQGARVGHVDLRAHPEPSTAHRSLLGMGVHRDHRRRGIGQAWSSTRSRGRFARPILNGSTSVFWAAMPRRSACTSGADFSARPPWSTSFGSTVNQSTTS